MTDSVAKTLHERGLRYGDFSDHADFCQGIKEVFYGAAGWENLPNIHKQALEVIADKIARILNGDPNYPDNWHDIQGYARLVEERLAGLSVAEKLSTELRSNISAAREQP